MFFSNHLLFSCVIGNSFEFPITQKSLRYGCDWCADEICKLKLARTSAQRAASDSLLYFQFPVDAVAFFVLVVVSREDKRLVHAAKFKLHGARYLLKVIV